MIELILILMFIIGTYMNYRGVRYWLKERKLAPLMRDHLGYGRPPHKMAIRK